MSMAKTLSIFHTGLIILANFQTRALLLEQRCGSHARGGPDYGHQHDHGMNAQASVEQLPPHEPYIRFDMDHLRSSTVPPFQFDGVDVIDGQLKRFGVVLLRREEIELVGKFKDKRLDVRTNTPAGEAPADEDEKGLYYWVANPRQFCQDDDITVKSEYLDDDPARGIASYIDVHAGTMRAVFGPRKPRVWAFRPRARGERDHAQALASAVVKTLVIDGNQPVRLRLRRFGEKQADRELVFEKPDRLNIVIGNSTMDNILGRPKVRPRAPDNHFSHYYEYLCPEQRIRPVPHQKRGRRRIPDHGGDDCPTIDPRPDPWP